MKTIFICGNSKYQELIKEKHMVLANGGNLVLTSLTDDNLDLIKKSDVVLVYEKDYEQDPVVVKQVRFAEKLQKPIRFYE